MTSTVSIRLPMPPSVNGLFPTNRRTGKRYASRQYQRWQHDAAWLIALRRLKPLSSPVDIEIALTPADGRRRDADNYGKPIIDQLVKAGLLKDDNSKHVRRVSLSWREPSKTEAGALVTITSLAA